MKFLIGLLFSFSALALPVPTLVSPVMDEANILNSQEKSQLDQKIRDIHKKGIIQITVLTIPSLEGEILEDYSIKVVDKWKLGDAKKDNGVLILVAMAERKLRIEVGNGIEGDITDLEAKRIIDNMKSYMRSKDFSGALNMAVDSLVERMEYNSPENVQLRAEAAMREAKQRAEQHRKFNQIVKTIFPIFALIVLLFTVISGISRKKSLSEEIPKKKELAKKVKSGVEGQNTKLKSMSVNQKSQEYSLANNRTQELTSRRDSLESEIKRMKKYLGRR